MRLLKRMVGAPASTTNSFLFLELGVLPIEAEILKRQLLYLYRILALPHDDPVRKMFENMVSLDSNGESNWWTYKRLVNKSVEMEVFESLKSECRSKTKTSHLCYDSFGTRNYLLELYPNQSKMVFKSRCKILDLKTQRPYMFKDTMCRKCLSEEETFEHASNCGYTSNELVNIDTASLGATSLDGETAYKLAQVAMRLETFCEIDTATMGTTKRKNPV
jgi:hypothetical protein